MYRLVQIIEFSEIIKITVANYDYRGVVTETCVTPFLTVPHRIEQKRNRFLKDDFFLFDLKSYIAIAIDKSKLIVLPRLYL